LYSRNPGKNSFQTPKTPSPKHCDPLLARLQFARQKMQGNRIHTVPGIFFRKTFACKDMSQVRSAVGAENFRPLSVRIRLSPNRTRHFLLETGPAAMSLEFGAGIVKKRAAAFAQIDAVFIAIVVFAGERPLCSFAFYHSFLLWR
jgi:hypothetical protein